MFANDFDKLNHLYNTRIFIKESVGLGPKAEDETYEAPSRRCLKCERTDDSCNCGDKHVESEEEEEVLGDGDSITDEYYETGEHPEHKASNMVKQNLYRIAKLSAMLYDIIPHDSEIEPWIADKLSKAAGNINDILSYKDYEEYKNKVLHDIELEEKTEQDLYSSIDDGGEKLLNKIREIMEAQPKERVETAVYSMIQMLEA